MYSMYILCYGSCKNSAALFVLLMYEYCHIICIGILFKSYLFLSMFNGFYSLSRFCSDVCDLLIYTFDAYFIKLFRIRIRI